MDIKVNQSWFNLANPELFTAYLLVYLVSVLTLVGPANVFKCHMFYYDLRFLGHADKTMSFAHKLPINPHNEWYVSAPTTHGCIYQSERRSPMPRTSEIFLPDLG